MLEEIKNIKTGKSDLRKFGITIGVFLLIISGFIFINGNEHYHNLLVISSIFIFLGLIIPVMLKPLYIIWMVFALILGWFMTRLILSILFYFIITPIGLIGKLCGQKFLGNDFTASTNSYWNLRDSKTELNQDYENQF
jgi:hypothetical protein